VVAPGQALTAALALADLIGANAPLAVQASKRIAYGAEDGRREDEVALWSLTDREMAVLAASEDAKEGPLAFTQKRAPVWTGR
jgi:crotonobetainyl-CoA hydratase